MKEIKEVVRKKENTHGGNIYSFARKKGIEKAEIIDFSANINPLGMSPKGREAMEKAIEGIIHYPDPDNYELIKAIARHYKVDEETVVLGNGGSEIIYAICRLKGKEKIVVTAPAFSEYSKAAIAADLPVESVFVNINENFSVSKDIWKKISLEKTILFLGNPNNPDGSMYPLEEGLWLLEYTKDKNCLVVMDESFMDFSDDIYSYRRYLKAYSHLIILHSFTKFFAVPGLRIGAGFMHPVIAKKIRLQIPTWSVNHLSNVYMVAALDDEEYISNSRKFMANERKRVYELYAEIPGVQPYFPSADFMLFYWSYEKKSGQDLQKYLEDRYILIRSCMAYDNLGDNWFRIAIKDREKNDKLFLHIKEFLDE